MRGMAVQGGIHGSPRVCYKKEDVKADLTPAEVEQLKFELQALGYPKKWLAICNCDG